MKMAPNLQGECGRAEFVEHPQIAEPVLPSPDSPGVSAVQVNPGTGTDVGWPWPERRPFAPKREMPAEPDDLMLSGVVGACFSREAERKGPPNDPIPPVKADFAETQICAGSITEDTGATRGRESLHEVSNRSSLIVTNSHQSSLT